MEGPELSCTRVPEGFPFRKEAHARRYHVANLGIVSASKARWSLFATPDFDPAKPGTGAFSPKPSPSE